MRRVEDPVNAQGEFDDTEIRPQVPTCATDPVDEEAADLGSETCQLAARERSQVTRTTNLGEQGHGGQSRGSPKERTPCSVTASRPRVRPFPAERALGDPGRYASQPLTKRSGPCCGSGAASAERRRRKSAPMWSGRDTGSGARLFLWVTDVPGCIGSSATGCPPGSSGRRTGPRCSQTWGSCDAWHWLSLPGIRHRFSFPELHDCCAILRNQMLSEGLLRMLPTHLSNRTPQTQLIVECFRKNCSADQQVRPSNESWWSTGHPAPHQLIPSLELGTRY